MIGSSVFSLRGWQQVWKGRGEGGPTVVHASVRDVLYGEELLDKSAHG
jgi:hypothetical protein